MVLILGKDVPWWALVPAALVPLPVAFYLYETRNFNYWKKQGIPYIKPMLVLGTMYRLAKGYAGAELEIYEEYKEHKMVGQFFGDRPMLSVWDEQFVADVIIKESSTFVNHFAMNDPGSLTDNMLVNMKDEVWKHTRTEMSPTFTTGKLKNMHTEINRCAKAFAEYVLEKAVSGEDIDVKDFTGGYTMDVISSTAFGMRVDSQKDKDNVFVQRAKAIFEFRMDNFQLTLLIGFYFPKLASLLRKFGISCEAGDKQSEAFFVNVVKQALQMRKEDTDQSRTDFLQLMINAQKGEDIQDQEERISTKLKGLTTHEILANAMLFFAAGYDTTANTLAFLMFNLATNPDIQTRLIEEIDSVVKDKESVSYSMLQELPYLEQCINETLRLYPIALVINRVANRDITLQGVYIRKGVIVQVPVFAMQRDQDRWPQPDKFDPDRFSAENKKNRNPYHYMPFGGGPRVCLGMRLALQELKMAVVHMLKRVTLETCDQTEIPIKFDNTALLRPANLWLRTLPR